MEIRELTCIGCPLGCNVTVTLSEGAVTDISGNTCPKGDAYARKEVTHPTRIVTSTVRVLNGTSPMVSVKTASDIPKDKIFDCIRAIRTATAPAPVKIGDVILKDAAGTGVPVVATKNIAKKED